MMGYKILCHKMDHFVEVVWDGQVTFKDLKDYETYYTQQYAAESHSELLDFSSITETDLTEPQLHAIADLAGSKNSVYPFTQLALIVNSQLHYGLGRMFGGIRESQPESQKEVGVFYKRDDALKWLQKQEVLST